MDILTKYATVLLIFLLTYCMWKLIKGKQNRGKQIPGPPLVEGMKNFTLRGCDNTTHLYLSELAEKYGNIFQVNLLIQNIVVINDPDIFRRLVKDSEFRDFTNDRPNTFTREYVTRGDKDIILATSGPVLQQRRKVFHNILKFYGEGKSQFEQLMITTLGDLTQTFIGKDTIELPASIRNYILRLVGFLLTGDISADGQQKLVTMQHFSAVSERLFAFQNETALQFLPLLRFVPGLRFKRLYKQACDSIDMLHKTYFYPMKETYNPQQSRGMIDELLSIQQGTADGNSSQLQMDDSIIKVLIQDVVSAAYLTTSSTLSSLFLHLMKFQDIQARMYDEIKRVIADSTPSFRHRQSMPFTEAVILETLRITSTAPLLLPHMINEDVTFEGYFLPKSSILIMNAWYCHHQQSFWKDPFSFRPDRFLDANGQLLESDHPNRQKMIPFGSGGRACPGETFARSRVFMVVTFLLKSFQFLPIDKETFPSLDPREWPCGTILSPENYRCKIISRHKD